MRKILGSVFGAAGLFALAFPASASPLIGSSSGTFDTVTSCTGNNMCTVSPSNVLTWYNSTNAQGPSTESTLTADPISFSALPGTTGIVVGELTWVAGTTNVTPDFNYNLAITITSPNSAADNQTIALNVSNTATGENLNGFDLNLLSSMNVTFADGSTLSNFQYLVDNGTLDQTGGAKNRTDHWDVSDSTTNDLFITADYTAVPEPLTLSLFGAGLAGAATIRRRRKTKRA